MSETSSKSSLMEKFVPVLVLVSFMLAFGVGVLWNKVSSLEKGGVAKNLPTDNTVAPDQVEGKLTEDQFKKIIPVSDKDRILGSKDADIIMIEYSDFECPFCEKFHPTAKQAMEEYKGKIAWVYRHYPLTFHPRALPSANAAECVANLVGNDAFWKFSDTVFGNQTKYLTDEGLLEAAVLAGARKADFSSCFADEKYKADIDASMQGGADAGITGTPGTFLINKKGEAWLVPGAVPYTTLKSMIDEALK